MKVFSFKNIRILILLSLLAFAAIYSQEQRLNTTSWYQPTPVVIYPINGDGNPNTQLYIENLSSEDFADIDAFFIKNSKHYNLIVDSPFITTLGNSISSHPPSPPADRNSAFKVMLWSLKLRYWTYRYAPDTQSNSNRIRLYVLYHQGSEEQPLEHSLGLQQGLIGIIHAYAKPQQNTQNSLIMAHEILHTVGATDKYDYRNTLPIYPDGYVKPQQQPLYPQRFAELMAGRIPVNAQYAKMPSSLRFCRIGLKTAQEINWISTQ